MKYSIDYFKEWRESFDDAETTYDQDMCAFAEWYHQKREQERQGPAPDRDELARTMPVDHLPQLKDTATFTKVCDKLGIECDQADPVSFIKASLEYDSRVRYMYADAMLKARKVQPVAESIPDPDLQRIQNVLDTCKRLGCTPSELLKMNYMSELKK